NVSASLLVLLALLPTIHSQFFNLEAFRVRLPGKCQPGYFDCGRGQCVHLRCFHDGKPDCWDGSDEFCFPGHIKCGSYCVELSYLGQCLANSRCNGAHNEPTFCRQTKEKICREELALPCKGYGECVLWSWARDEKRDCLDGSDLDGNYMELLQSQWIHIMPTSAGAIGSTQQELPHATTAFIPYLGGSLQPSTNISDPTPVLVVSPTPPAPSPTLLSSLPTVSSQPPGYEPQSPTLPYSISPFAPPNFSPPPFSASPPIVPIVKIQSYPMTTPVSPTQRPGPIPVSGFIPLTHPPLAPPQTTPRNPFEEAETASVPSASEELFFGSSETPGHPIDYPDDYTATEPDGTVVPHYGVPPSAAPAAAGPAAASIYPVFVGQTHPPHTTPPVAIQPVLLQPERPVFRPFTLQPSYGAVQPAGPVGPAMPQYPYVPTIFPDRRPMAPISAATAPPHQPPPFRPPPFSVIPFGVAHIGGTSPTSGQTIPNETPYHPQVQQNRPPWQQPPGTAGPPIGAIHPISPTGHQGGPAPIAGMTPGPYQPGEYRPSFGTPYPYTP
ncbi:hypothetical protein PENTCL1PPCAC_29743, partial [Pristionchus entomophagus]